jgi:RimJ/RimL family protein N-acetyltransferase
MLDYAFQFVDKVIFHVGANNIRSQKAMEKLGAVNLGLEEVAYYGEATRTNFVYAMYRDVKY